MLRYRRVTLEDRYQIQAYLLNKLSAADIAKKLGFHKCSICREIRRNSVNGIYLAKVAHEFSRGRFVRCRRPRVLTPALGEKIESYLKDWSPVQVCGRFKREKVFCPSHETIYKFVRNSKKFELLRRQGRRMGHGRYTYRVESGRKKYPDWYRSIRTRGAGANNRSRIGHWERDTMFVAKRKMVLVCADRKSRFTKLMKVNEPIGVHLADDFKKMMSIYPLKSITNDNGSEFKDGWNYKVPVYYCKPRAPQQRGTIENTIGLLRQYIKKDADHKELTQEKLNAIERNLNLRPRKVLDYRTPYEVFYKIKVALVV